MIARNTDALIFDFDGVLVESTEVKTQAFADIYREYGGAVAARAVEYHLEHAGISRFIKFRHLHQTLLGVELTEPTLAQLGERFSQLVEDAVVTAPWVAGAREFLEAYRHRMPLFIASGTPEEELKRIVQRRGMEGYFVSVHGTPADKGEIIGSIVQVHGFRPERVVMVGDAASDYDGAREAGVWFIGRVAGSSSPFPPGTITLPNLLRLPECLSH